MDNSDTEDSIASRTRQSSRAQATKRVTDSQSRTTRTLFQSVDTATHSRFNQDHQRTATGVPGIDLGNNHFSHTDTSEQEDQEEEEDQPLFTLPEVLRSDNIEGRRALAAAKAKAK